MFVLIIVLPPSLAKTPLSMLGLKSSVSYDDEDVVDGVVSSGTKGWYEWLMVCTLA